MQYFGFDRPSFAFKTFGFGTNSDDAILALFAGGKQGVWYDPSDKSTLFQDVAGTVPVTKDGDPVALMRDKSDNGNHATQTVSTARPVKTPLGAYYDSIDDDLVIKLPVAITGNLIMVTDDGAVSYGVNIPAGDFSLKTYVLAGKVFKGAILVSGELDSIVEQSAIDYLLKGANNVNFSTYTSLANTWMGNKTLVRFPLIDTSNVTSLSYTWFNCSNLKSLPLIDTSKVTDMNLAWRGCGLTSFPLIDTSSVISADQAWSGCQITVFPALNLSKCVSFNAAWQTVPVKTFPLLDYSSGKSFNQTWYTCRSLTDFPLNSFDNVKGGDFYNAFLFTNLSQASIDGILISLVASGVSSGTRVFGQSGGSAPSSSGKAAIDTLRSRGWTVTVTGGY